MVTYLSGTERSIWTWSHSIETCLLSYCIKTSSFLPELKFYFWILRSFFLGGVTFAWLRAAHEIIFITYNVKKFNMQIHWPVKGIFLIETNAFFFLLTNTSLPQRYEQQHVHPSMVASSYMEHSLHRNDFSSDRRKPSCNMDCSCT